MANVLRLMSWEAYIDSGTKNENKVYNSNLMIYRVII